MLVALGIGAAVVEWILRTEMATAERSRVAVIAAGGFGLCALALTSFGRARLRLRGQRLDEQATEEFNFRALGVWTHVKEILESEGRATP
jgi:hypothetical protein